MENNRIGIGISNTVPVLSCYQIANKKLAVSHSTSEQWIRLVPKENSEMTAALTVGIFVKGVFSTFKNFTIFLPFRTKISLNMIVGIIVFMTWKN